MPDAPGAESTLPSEVALRCACGTLRGSYRLTRDHGARSTCYCDDCQAYARFLRRDDLLDAWGGTEVIQSWPAQIRLEDGLASLSLVRLSERGLHRWYAGCCRAPIANTMANPRLPFAGLIRQTLVVDDARL